MDPQALARWRAEHPPIMGADPATDAREVIRRAPKEDLVRAVMPSTDALEVRSEHDDAGTEANTLHGHFSVFDRWTKIDSFIEGRFLERVAPGAFRKTFTERKPKITLNHGMDPMYGDRVLGTITNLTEDERGAYYEARLFDGLDPVLLQGLRAGEYGSSFRFSVVREHWDDRPDPSEDNPDGLPQRTLKEVRCSEFGPVTFPAYADATAGVRSMTDEVVLGRAISDPARLEQYLDYLRDRDGAAKRSRGISVPAWTPEQRAALDAAAAVAKVCAAQGIPADSVVEMVRAADEAADKNKASAREGDAAKDAPDGADAAAKEGEDDDANAKSDLDEQKDTAAGIQETLETVAAEQQQLNEQVKQDQAQQGQQETDAPSNDRAAQNAHPDGERRDDQTTTTKARTPLYGLDEQENSWRI